MNAKRLTRHIAAAALATALAIGGLVGVGAVDQPDVPQEHAGGTWSFTGKTGGGATTNGSTWS